MATRLTNDQQAALAIKRAGKDGKTMMNSIELIKCKFFDGRGKRISLIYLALITVSIASALLLGCHADPNVAKQKYLESGKRYSADGKYQEAGIQFANALKLDKNFAEAHYQLAQVDLHLKQYQQAYIELQRAVDLQPSNFDARLGLANLLLLGGKTADAQQQANALMATQPNNADLHALLSAIALRSSNKDLALAEMQRAADLDPKRASFHESMAMLRAADPSQTGAVEAELQKAVALEPKSVTTRTMLASFYMKNQRWGEAEQQCWAAIAADPKSLPAREAITRLFLAQGNQARAEEILRQTSKDLSDNPQAVQVLADYYVAQGQPDKARTEFARLTAQYPASLLLKKGYIRALLQTNDIGTAQKLIDELLKKKTKDPEITALNGIVMLQTGKVEEALTTLQSAVRDFPDNAFLEYWLGKAALAKGDQGQAEKSFLEAVRLNHNMIQAEEELAQIAAARGDMKSLSAVADRTIAATPRFPLAYVWRAITEESTDSLNNAEADLKTAIAMAPQSSLGYIQLGKLRVSQKKYPEAAALFQQALDKDPESVEALRLLVGYDLLQKQPKKASDRLNAQISKSPSNSKFLDLLAQLDIQNKDLAGASAAAQKAIQLNPNDNQAVMLYASIQVQNGQTATAINAWQQWFNAHPKDANAIAVLGTLEQSRGDLNKAKADYTQALQIDPRQAMAANNLAFLMLESGGNIDVALTYAQTARQGMPDSPDAADTLAWAYYYKGTYGFARDLLEDALKTDPNNAAMQYHLGMVYSKLSDKSSAQTHLKKAIALEPNSPSAKSAQAALNGVG